MKYAMVLTCNTEFVTELWHPLDHRGVERSGIEVELIVSSKNELELRKVRELLQCLFEVIGGDSIKVLYARGLAFKAEV